MRGFCKDDKTQTGFLGLDNQLAGKRRGSVYKIVDDLEDALKFPSENVYGKEGFGTPKQWLEFFKGEDELSSWKFHLMKTNRY